MHRRLGSRSAALHLHAGGTDPFPLDFRRHNADGAYTLHTSERISGPPSGSPDSTWDARGEAEGRRRHSRASSTTARRRRLAQGDRSRRARLPPSAGRSPCVVPGTCPWTRGAGGLRSRALGTTSRSTYLGDCGRLPVEDPPHRGCKRRIVRRTRPGSISTSTSPLIRPCARRSPALSSTPAGTRSSPGVAESRSLRRTMAVSPVSRARDEEHSTRVHRSSDHGQGVAAALTSPRRGLLPAASSASTSQPL